MLFPILCFFLVVLRELSVEGPGELNGSEMTQKREIWVGLKQCQLLTIYTC